MIAGAVFAVHLAVNAASPYGFHRDEFLYLAMGRHLRLWAMDFPPFIAIAARAVLETIGGSLVAVRLLPAAAAALLVLATGWIARRLGGGLAAVVIAALAVALSPLFMRAGSLFQPVVFDQLWWTLALTALMLIPARGVGRTHRDDGAGQDGGARAWLLLGAALGVGLLTKYSIAFIGIGITVAVLATPLRRWLSTPWPWAAVALALVIGSPSILGQVNLGFPVLAQMSDLRGSQLERIGPREFIGGNLEFLGPAVLLAVAGLVELFRRRRAAGERAVAWAVVTTFVLLMVLRGKAYYVGPIYPVLFAAGAVWIGARSAAVRWSVAALIVVAGLVALPFGLPVLQPPAMVRYAAAIGIGTETNEGEVISLPQDYADMLGWEAQAAATARVFGALPPNERGEAAIIGTNYGRAGAHDHLGVPLGMPPAVAPIGSYWFFGPGNRAGRVAVVIGGSREDLAVFYDSITPGARVTDTMRVPEERDVTIWVARAPRQTLQELWPRFEGRN